MPASAADPVPSPRLPPGAWRGSVSAVPISLVSNSAESPPLRAPSAAKYPSGGTRAARRQFFWARSSRLSR